MEEGADEWTAGPAGKGPAAAVQAPSLVQEGVRTSHLRGCAFSSGRAAEGTHGGIQCSLGSKGERVWLVGMPRDLLVMEKIVTVCIYHEHPPLLLPLATIKLSLCTLLLQGEEGVGAAGRCQLPGTATPQAPPSLGAWFA